MTRRKRRVSLSLSAGAIHLQETRVLAEKATSHRPCLPTKSTTHVTDGYAAIGGGASRRRSHLATQRGRTSTQGNADHQSDTAPAARAA
ncbi:MAG: hypothetical protein IPL05_04615 [Betaproteobacteria bacterium]|nr:hypothetical protein [Betaproteobacteria bacterium]